LNDRNRDHQPSGAEARLLLPVPACLITRLLTLDRQTPSASAARRKLRTMSNCHAAANSYDTRSSPRNQLPADCSSLRAQRSNTMHCKILTSLIRLSVSGSNGSKHPPSRKRQSLGVTARRRLRSRCRLGGERMTVNVNRIPNRCQRCQTWALVLPDRGYPCRRCAARAASV
jgi:hypothetical protein